MSKFRDKIKDFFYDTTDYVIIIAILLIVVLIITWRLNVLFAKNTPDPSGSQTVVEETQDDESQDSSDDSASEEDPPEDEAPAEEVLETVMVEIPEGATSQTIANILFESGLIEDKIEFLQTSRDLGLDTQFRPGEYEFQSGMSLEAVIRRIARQEIEEAETQE